MKDQGVKPRRNPEARPLQPLGAALALSRKLGSKQEADQGACGQH
jgi:hypothetical protein